MTYAVYDPMGTNHSNDALVFDGREIDLGVDDEDEIIPAVSQVIRFPLGHIGATVWVEASVNCSVQLQELTEVVADPRLSGSGADADFVDTEPAISVSADEPKLYDMSRVLLPFRLKVTPESADAAWTLRVHVKRKG